MAVVELTEDNLEQYADFVGMEDIENIGREYYRGVVITDDKDDPLSAGIWELIRADKEEMDTQARIVCLKAKNDAEADKLLETCTLMFVNEDVKVRDIVFALGASTNSNYARQFELPGVFAPIADFGLLKKAVDNAEMLGASYHVGNVLSSDTFYDAQDDANDRWIKMGVLCIEMETAALYMNAAKAHKKALGMFTVSDHILTGEALSAEERQTSFRQMMEIALKTAAELAD